MTQILAHLPRSRRGLVVGMTSVLFLVGCSGLIGPTNPPAQVYVLQPDLHAIADAPNVPWQLSIAHPGASESLDTGHIVLHRGQIADFYAGAEWTDSAPSLIQAQLIETFEKSGKIGAVSATSGSVRADYVLDTEIRDFEARYDSPDGAPTVVVDIVARLLSAQSREVVATLNSHHEAQAARNDIPSVIQAFDESTGATFDEIAAWTLRTPRAAESTPAPAAPRTHRHHKIAS